MMTGEHNWQIVEAGASANFPTSQMSQLSAALMLLKEPGKQKVHEALGTGR
jgi:hypothetical protein